MIRKTLAVATVVMALGALAPATPASATASPGFTGTFTIKCCLTGQTTFKVAGDGKVTVKSKASGGVSQTYSISIERENCGSFGCHGWNSVGGPQWYAANGQYQTKSWNVGNSTRRHRLVFGKGDHSQTITGTVVVS
jgi:hypothetical protein